MYSEWCAANIATCLWRWQQPPLDFLFYFKALLDSVVFMSPEVSRMAFVNDNTTSELLGGIMFVFNNNKYIAMQYKSLLIYPVHMSNKDTVQNGPFA